MEDAHLKLLYEEQEEARELLRKEQDRALRMAIERDRQQLEEEQEDLILYRYKYKKFQCRN